MSKHFVKAIFGTIVSDEFVLQEGQIGVTSKPYLFKEMVDNGVAFMSENEQEVREFKFKSRAEMFNESYPSLNPREGAVPPPPSIDFKNVLPFKDENGIPMNYITKPEKKTEIKTPAASTPAGAPADTTGKTQEPKGKENEKK